MEDKHKAILSYSHGPGCPTTDYFALFDGHSGICFNFASH